jgi:uncharacterized protein (TIGR02266 family)
VLNEGSEQRAQPRLPCVLSVQLHAPTEDVLLLTYATDFSPAGVFVRANRPLPVGTRVRVELQPDRGQRVAIEGTVVRVANEVGGPRGMGLCFVPADEAASMELERMFERAGLALAGGGGQQLAGRMIDSRSL